MIRALSTNNLSFRHPKSSTLDSLLPGGSTDVTKRERILKLTPRGSIEQTGLKSRLAYVPQDSGISIRQ